MTVNLNVGGVNRSYDFEYTLSITSSIYQELLGRLQTIGNSTGTLTNADLDEFNNAMVGLKAMLTERSVDRNGSLYNLESGITGQMAQGILSLLQLNKSINPNVQLDATLLSSSDAGLVQLSQLTQWRDLYHLGIGDTIQAIKIGAAAAPTTLQSLVELEYVQGGNDLIYKQLSGLNEAMTATQKALTLLENLQLVKNRAALVQNTYTAASQWEHGSAFIGFPTVNILICMPKSEIKTFPEVYKDTTKDELGLQLKITSDPTFATDLISQGPALIAQLQQTIKELGVVIPSGTNPPSLVDQLTTILNDIQAGEPGVFNQTVQQKFAWWLLDNYNSSTASVSVPGIGTIGHFSAISAGNYQRNLINATAAAQTLSSSQNTQLQQTVFIFQEFYKSASALLHAIQNIVMHMGQNEAA